jgi:hypothetical protein
MELVLLALSKPFALKTPFSIANGWSATHDRYDTISVANENLTSFLAVLKLFHVCIHNRLEDTQTSYHQNNL